MPYSSFFSIHCKEPPDAIPLTENEREWALLRADPGALVLKYQETIRIIVRRFIGTGMFSAREFEDVVQSVNAGLLSRTSSMQRNYSGRSLLATYVSAIIRNICLKLRRVATRAAPCSAPQA